MPGQKASEEQRRAQIIAATYQVAARDGLERLTVREVAAAAGLSNGLIFFHYTNKETLLLALLDDLCAWLVRAGRPAETAAVGDQFIPLLHQEATFEGDDRARIELFLEFWVLGAHQPQMRDRLRVALRGYRSGFVAPARTALPHDSPVMAEALAALGASLVVGSALQAAIDPEQFDPHHSLAALVALLGAANRDT